MQKIETQPGIVRESKCLWCLFDNPITALQLGDQTGTIEMHAGCLREMLYQLRKMILKQPGGGVASE